MVKRVILAISIIISLMTGEAFAQNTVVGSVIDNTGEPLIGATVKVVGESQGTITDVDGRFSITVGKKAKQVEVSYVGYKTQIVNIKNGKADCRLSEDANILNEVVAIGYGSVKKGDITNAVAKVKGEVLAERPVANIASALQGELAGVDVQSTSGAPGSAVQIKVRGATSISEDASSNPLYVVDGVPMDEAFDLNTINPQDIQSIEVLKDASSSAIYGSRGANGVILITSKKGENNSTTRVTTNASFSISTPERYMPVFSSEDWIAWRQNYCDYKYVSGYSSKGAAYGDTYAEQMAITNGSGGVQSIADPSWKKAGYGGLSLVDWQKALFRPSISQNYNVSISQGSKQSNYRASVSYVHQDGIVINTGMSRLTAKLVAETTIKDKLTLGVDIAPQLIVTTGGNVDGKDNAAMSALNLVPVVEQKAGLMTAAQPYNRYIYAGSTVSPVAVLEQQSYRDEQIRIQMSGRASYQFDKYLKAEVLGSWIFNNRQRNRFIPSSANRYWNSGEGYYASSNWTGSRSHKYLAQATATYDRTFAETHHVNVVAGWSIESTQDAQSYTMAATQFPNNTIQGWTINDVEATTFTASYPTDNHLISYFARAEYGYDSRYLINASIRRDGSSRFGANRKWGTFPAVSAAWRMSNEKFWNDQWIVNQAKLRVSYGSNGSNSISANAADGLLGSVYYSQDGTVKPGYIPTSTANPDLGWQKTNSWNFGLDMSFFKNRISFAVDYYVKNINDMLYQVTLPSVMGYEKGWSNIGNIRTKGIEIELKTENLTGKLKWTTKASVGHSTNEVTDLGDNSAIYTGYGSATQIIEVGHPVGEYYLYIADGVYQTKEDLQRYPTEATSGVGSIRYRDVNGDGVINENDRTYCGKPQPSWTFGLTNTFKWKRWDASILFTAQAGGKIWSGLGRAIDMMNQGNSINRLDHWANMWISEEQPGNGSVPAVTGASSTEQFSTRWLYSTDFIKLKNITIGYRLNFGKKAFVHSLRITASAENVFMIDNYYGGYSPESNNSGSSISSYDYGAYPSARTFSVGLNATF